MRRPFPGGRGQQIADGGPHSGRRRHQQEDDVDARAEETVGQIGEAGGTAFLHTDVGDADQTGALARAAVDRFGSLDVAFNNVGLLPPTAPLIDQTLEDWHRRPHR